MLRQTVLRCASRRLAVATGTCSPQVCTSVCAAVATPSGATPMSTLAAHSASTRFLSASIGSSFLRRQMSSSTSSSPPASASSSSSVAPSSASAAVRPSKPKRVYPEDSGFFIIPDKKPERKGDDKAVKAWLQRGAPKARPLLPKPLVLAGVDRPWMQDELALHFEPTEHRAGFDLTVRQWTGMNFAAEDATDADPLEAGSGAIVWDAALHLLHYLHATGLLHSRGVMLELGSGTGALGLGAEKITGLPVVLTDEGPVLKLLQQNVDLNHSKARVLPFRWDGVDSFLGTLTAGSTPSFVSTILCSELLDTIPGPGNAQRPFDEQSFRTLVSTLTRLARESLAVQQRLAVPDASVEVLFTFEQRGVLNMREGGLLQSQLLSPLEQQGFVVARVHSDTYQPDSDLCLLRLTMK